MEPKCTVDPYDYLKITRHSDGSITSLFDTSFVAAAPDPDTLSPVLTKDVPINPGNATWLRIFLPRAHTQPGNASCPSAAAEKLPLIVYFHGGGFVILSVATAMCHDFCAEMALRLSAVVVSVEYRLAPKHRLPAAYDDAAEALRLLAHSDNEWLHRHADLSRCFLMGLSAGGNMAYHAGLRAAEDAAAGGLDPLRIRGLVLHHPFFGGSVRTRSEIRHVDDPVLPLSATDLMWELSLPVGSDRDHGFCNLDARGDEPDRFGRLRGLGWRVLVVCAGADPLVDRQVAVAEILEREGVEVEVRFGEGDYHGVEMFDLTKSEPLFCVMRRFMAKC